MSTPNEVIELAKKRSAKMVAEEYLAGTGIAETAVLGPEAQFFIFDNFQFDSKSIGTFYSVDSVYSINL
jgi:hypothetical protein